MRTRADLLPRADPVRRPRRPLLGAHVSIAGGIDRAVLRGARLGCETIQIFVKSNVRWEMRPLDDGERRRFAASLAESGIFPAFAHASYLINLASAAPAVRAKSASSLADELRRVSALGLPFIVLHPGSRGGAAEACAVRAIADSLDGIFDAVPGPARILLETTAGQGNSVGGRFEHLAAIIGAVERRERMGVCFDTCHVFAAGYELRTARGYRRTMGEFDRIAGLGRICAFHLNDCGGTLGSRLDRHRHIGKGALGLAAFALLLNDRRFAGLPMVIETPKGEGTALDRRNLRVLRRLLKI